LPATLDETYERTLREIKETKWESARQLLVCITVASRPLRVEELAEILAFDFKSGAIPKFHKDWRLENPVEAVLSACSTLLSVVNVETSLKSPRVVQFSHFTVKEYLTSSRFAEKHDNISRRYHISMSAAHTFVAQACLGVLLHLDKNITSQNLTEFPLAKYAAQHWFEHARFEGVSQDAVEGMKQLFDRTKPHFSIWLWIHDPTVPFWNRRKRAEGPSPPCGTPLHYAAFCGLHNIAMILAIGHPQDVNSQSFNDALSPLHVALCMGHLDLARMLVEHGADVSAQDKAGQSLLHSAVENGHVAFSWMLVERGADISAQDEDGWTAVHFALDNGHEDLARMLVERGADVSAQDESRWNELHMASRFGYVDLARMLVERGADVSAKTENGWTALYLTCYGGHVDLARMLVERGADVSAQCDEGRTALHEASHHGHVDLARLLLGCGADVSAQGDDGRTALHVGLENDHVDLAQMLVDCGADVSAQNGSGSTALHLASHNGHVALALMLMEHGADVSTQDGNRWTALHFASCNGHVDLARMLVERGANVSAQTEHGWTALTLASENGHAGLARMLVEHNSDIAPQATPQITTTTTCVGVHAE